MDKSRLHDISRMFPWLALFAFSPPLLMLFPPDRLAFGLPLLPVYLFAVWLALILATRHLTALLVEGETPATTDEPPRADSPPGNPHPERER